MVITSNVPPERNLYFLGGKILEVIIAQQQQQFDIVALFNALKERVQINFVLFTYALDWLYLAGLIQMNEDGSISKCF